MKIAIINTIKPHEGSGDGMTEYSYQLYTRLSRNNNVELIYPLNSSKRNDVFGLVYTNSVFKLKMRKLAKEDYDIIHIANHELGFVAKILKAHGSKAKIVTSIHDLMRVKDNIYHKGILQDAYSNIVSASVSDAIKFSDFIIFTASTVRRDAEKIFGDDLGRHVTTLLCPKEKFRTSKIPMKKLSTFKVGYIGALAFRKNVLFVLKTAEKITDTGDKLRFLIYGSGAEKKALLDYKEKNGLSNVQFMGFAKEESLMQTYDGLNLFFYPSLEEGSSLPILDAQARGLPVIVLKNNHLDNEVTKYCIKVKNESDAARIIINLMKKGYPKQMTNTLTKYARSFSWDRVAKETLAVYQKV